MKPLYYADALTLVGNDAPRTDAKLRERVSTICDEQLTPEGRIRELSKLLPKRHHSELRRVVFNVQKPSKLATWIFARV